LKNFREFPIREVVYLNRWKVLRKLGFNSYNHYLSSPLWRGIRKKVLTTHKFCRICHRKAVQVHHLSYSRAVLLGENLRPLVPICIGCHHKIEFDKQGYKRSFAGACYTYNQLMNGEQVS
jgi:hypothetical protein